MAALLQLLPHLGSLNVSENCFTDEGAEILSPAVAELSSLQEFDISSNSVGDDGLLCFVAALTHCPRLACLELSRNNLTEGSVRSLTSRLATHSSQLSHLGLAYVYIWILIHTRLSPTLANPSPLPSPLLQVQQAGRRSRCPGIAAHAQPPMQATGAYVYIIYTCLPLSPSLTLSLSLTYNSQTHAHAHAHAGCGSLLLRGIRPRRARASCLPAAVPLPEEPHPARLLCRPVYYDRSGRGGGSAAGSVL